MTKIKYEKELQSIIEKNLEEVESGLKILNPFKLPSGFFDNLAVDSGGRLVILEYKTRKINEHIIGQTLKYYYDVDSNRYMIANHFKNYNINPEEHPRLIIIGEKVPDKIRSLFNYVEPEIDLFEYGFNKINQIYFHPVSIPDFEEISFSKSITIDEQREYIKKDELKENFEKIINKVKDIDKEIKIDVKQTYLTFTYKGRVIGWLARHRYYIDFGYIKIDKETYHIIENKFQRIKEKADNYDETIGKIKNTFKILRNK